MKTNLTKTDTKLAKVNKLLNATSVDAQALKIIKLAIFDVALTAIQETAEEIKGEATIAESADVAIRRHTQKTPMPSAGDTESGMKIVSYGDNR